MKTVIYGGSFNPPHLGHENAVRAILKKLSPDRIFIIPTAMSPWKESEKGDPTSEEKMEMCRIAFEKFEKTEVLDIEIQRPGKSYTVDTVRELKAKYPNDRFYLPVGTDQIVLFEEWFEFREILSVCTLLAISREEDDDRKIREAAQALKKKYRAKVIIIKNEAVVISSSEIREKKDGRGLSEGVFRYIQEHHLYS